MSEYKGLLKCRCGSYFFTQIDLEDHQKVCGRRCDCPRHRNKRKSKAVYVK